MYEYKLLLIEYFLVKCKLSADTAYAFKSNGVCKTAGDTDLRLSGNLKSLEIMILF